MSSVSTSLEARRRETRFKVSALFCLLLISALSHVSTGLAEQQQPQQDELLFQEEDYLNLISSAPESGDQLVSSSSSKHEPNATTKQLPDYAATVVGDYEDSAASEELLLSPVVFESRPLYASLLQPANGGLQEHRPPVDYEQPIGSGSHFHPERGFYSDNYNSFSPPPLTTTSSFKFTGPAAFAEPLRASAPPPTSQQAADGGQLKVGPQFVREPPSLVHYLNSSDLIIPCSASGNPPPTISWWHKSGQQLETGSLLDKRYVRYDNALVISAFKAPEFEPEIHSTVYRCQATNSLGTIVSRDVVINAVIDQDYEVSVPDQFVSVDNDALFKCQLAPQMRELFQVIGWLEDGQQLVSAAPGGQQQQLAQHLFARAGARAEQPAAGQRRRQPQQQLSAGSARAVLLPDGQLLLARVQLRDANKSFRCQLRNQLSGRVSLSSISGRLFVTDSNESGAAPKIVEAPRAISYAKLNEQLLLTCLAQGSPRPTVRWFRQQSLADGQSAAKLELDEQPKLADWLELPPTTSSPPANATDLQQQQQKYLVSSDGTLLLLRAPQPADQLARFKCLANNSFGAQKAETELRLDLWPAQRLVELEPRLEFVHNNQQQQQPVAEQLEHQRHGFALNCTVRQSASQPLHSLEWLKNGQQLFSVSLAQLAGASSSPFDSHHNSSASMFDDPNQELSLVEFGGGGGAANELEQLAEQESNAIEHGQGEQQQRNNFLVVATTLNKLNQQQLEPARFKTHHHHQWPRQTLRMLARDTLLYQLHFATPLRRADRGSYQCRAHLARAGIVHATSQLLLKDNPPRFVETFASQLVARQLAGQPTSLKCVASGSPLPEISWTLSGFPVPESNRFRSGDYVTRDGLIVSFVNISSVQVEDGGLYECSATNDVGQLRHAAWLNVTGPAYVRPMPNVSAIAGDSLAIMCPVGGWPIEQISWFQNSTKLPLNHRQKLFPNGTLIISELNEVTDSGQYSCQARSAPSAASMANQLADELVALNHVHIQIKVPPLLEPFSFAKSLHRGQRYNIMCTVIRGDLPVSIRWLKDGRPLALAPSGQLQQQQPTAAIESEPPAGSQAATTTNGIIAVKQLDPYSSTLTFASLQAQHRGQYTCEATNEAGRANQSSSLVIHVPPEWRIEPRDLSVTVGKTAVIDCQADGFPAARIEWRLSQDLFREPPSEFKPIISSLYMRVFENGSLIIYNTQRSDAGYYLCQANNGIGPGISRVIKLTVHVAAHFKTKIKTELVRLQQPAKLRCESIGDLPIEINWLKDKMPLYAADEPRYALAKSQLQDGVLSELTIGETQRADSALFTCITQNQFGSDDTNIQLVVQSEPDQPQEVRLHEYESRSVKIGWLPGHSGNSPVTKYLIMYAPVQSAAGQPQQQQPGAAFTNVSVDGAESSLLLQGLVPLTEYQFQILALNSIGSSRPLSEPIKFRTDDEAPSLPPLFVKAQAVSSKSLKVRWRVPERRTHYGAISGFYVGYKLIGGAGGLAGPQQGVTKAGQAAQESFVYKTINYQPTSNLAAGPDQNKSALGQQLEQECQLNGLRRGQKYLITVQAFNGRGTGPASEQIIAETWRFDVPDAPSLRMISRTTHSVHLAWRLASSSGSPAEADGKQKLRHLEAANKPAEGQVDAEQQPTLDNEQANEPIFGFILTRRQITSSGQQATQPDDQLGHLVEWRLPADHMSQIVENLTCGTRYQFTIAALNSVGASAPSEPLVVKTDGSPPVAPDRSSLLSMNSSSVLINLGAWHDGSCQMYSFDILFKTSRSKKWSTLTNYQIARPPAPQLQADNTTSSSRQQPVAQRSISSAGGHLPANGTIVLDDLSNSVNYDLKIVATNEAGTTEQTYTFNTNGFRLHNGNDQFLIGGSGEFELTTNNLVNELFGGQTSSFLGPFVPFILLLVVLMLALSTGCILLARRRHASSSSCSLSISSTGRSASSNYYTTNGAAADQTNKSVLTNNIGSSSGHSGTTSSTTLQTRSKQSGANNCDSLRELDDVSPNTIQQFNLHHQNGSSTLGHPLHHYHNQLVSQQAQHIYGAATMRRAEPMANKSNYAFLAAANQQRPASPQQTDLTSVLNGSETEMCLGASALNIAQQQDGKEEEQKQKQQQMGYYVAPATLLLANKNSQQQQQLLLNQLASKSSTLPANCHQQIMQQLLQQQQVDGSSPSASNNQQLLLNSLVANANLIQQQQPTNGDEEAAYIQVALQQQQQQQQLMDSIQHQQQVYATVKRGCPRLPRLCDYSTSAGGYQCPGLTQQCCGDLKQKQPAGCFHQQDELLMMNNGNNMCPQQQQQQPGQPMATTQMGDYQQLQRPQIN